MKKVILLSIAALVSFAACQKNNPAQQENKVTSLTANIEQHIGDTKTAIGAGNTVVWSEGDVVKVWDASSSSNANFTLVDGAGTTQGLFSGEDISPDYALYPASIVSSVSGSTVTITLPATQTYTANTFGNGANVAVAQIDGNSMAFKNVCGVLKLQLKGTAVVKSIVVSGRANEKLNGTYSIDASATTPDMTFTTTSTASEKSVTLDCGGGVLLDPAVAKNFYIVVPKGSFADGFNVTVNNFSSASENIIAVCENTINRNVILAMPERILKNKGHVLPGRFSVSGTGQQVKFSQGNLMASIDASGNPTAWKFAEHQYDFLGKDGANLTIGSAAGDIDLFGWSSDGSDAGSGYKPWGINGSDSMGDYYGSFVDWATNDDFEADFGKVWRTITAYDFEYLLNTRLASTINDTANARYAMIIVGSVKGILLFPDDFTWNTTTMGQEPTIINNHSMNYNEYNYSLIQFNAIESAGGVFLPAAGYACLSGDKQLVSGGRGDYRTSSVGKSPKIFLFSSTAFRVGDDSYFSRKSVRLVADAD